MSSMDVRWSSLTLTVRSKVRPSSKTWETTCPASVAPTNSLNSGTVTPNFAMISLLGRIISWGRSTCCSTLRSAIPSTSCTADLIWFPMENSLFKSAPNILIATLALDPESIASILWDMGCPISRLTPDRSSSFFRSSLATTSLFLSSNTKGASISETFTPKACSSSSARPVFRTVVCTSGMVKIISSAIRPILSDSSNEVPGVVATLMVNEPSLNGGRNDRPKVVNRAMDATKTTAQAMSTVFL